MGILTNSQILIVGAMVVGPEYNAIIATALGFSIRDRPLARDGLFALLWGFVAAIVMTLLFGLAVKASGDTPAQYLQGVRPVADLINTPNVFSVIVAILAGLVGVISLTESRANALIGVFISVTTIPAAASVGVSVAYASWSEAWGSLLQLLLNVVLLTVVGAGGLSTQRMIWRRRQQWASQPRGWGRGPAPADHSPGIPPAGDVQDGPPAPAQAARLTYRPGSPPGGGHPGGVVTASPAQGNMVRHAATPRLAPGPGRADQHRPGAGGRLIYDGLPERPSRAGRLR